MSRRDSIARWLRAGLDSVNPERLTRDAFDGRVGPVTVLAIGKAGAAMCRGAASALGRVEGLCVTSEPDAVPDSVELLVGDHPLPGEASMRAGLRAIDVSSRADVALISGGGSSLCEVPADGVSLEFVADVYKKLLDAGTSITDVNVVRSHLSRVKGGGLGPLPTYILSDVAGAGPEMVSSGPTLGIDPDPDRVLRVMKDVGISIDTTIEQVIRGREKAPLNLMETIVLADGKTAARAVCEAVDPHIPTHLQETWIEGDFRENLHEFVSSASPGITVAAGEASVPAGRQGRGGRCTHTALIAAQMLASTEICFAALATDGVDGRSGSAGAIVDGTTISRGGDPALALSRFDSAEYLDRTGDIIVTGPTGTNVADLWLIWKPEGGSEPILSV